MRTILSMLTITVLLAQTAAAEKSDPLAVLKSADATYKDKADACRQLARTGGADAVSVLAPMLLVEKTSHIARNALEPMPFPEAGAALRDALAKTQGRLKIGMISSLGIRKDTQAVPALCKLLSTSDSMVARAAAGALGTIATDEAVDALKSAMANADLPAETMRALGDALLDVAEDYAKAGKRDAAAALYDRLMTADKAPIEIRIAAMRGAVLTQKDAKKAAALLKRMLDGDCADTFDGGLRTARDWPNTDKMTDVLVGSLEDLEGCRKIQVMAVLGKRGGPAAGPALLRQAARGKEHERAAAIAALTSLAHEPAIPLLARLAWTGEGEVAEAARHGLSYFPAEAADKALRDLLDHQDAKARVAAVEMIGQGGLDKPGPLLLATATKDADETVRLAALKALANYAGQAELDGLLGAMSAARTEGEVRAAEAIIHNLCRSLKGGIDGVVVTKAVYGDLAGGKTKDVTKKVQQLVADGAASVEASNSNFGDPASGVRKQLRIDYQVHGVARSDTVAEGKTLTLSAACVPAEITAKLIAALPIAKGEARHALLRLLSTAGGPKALDAVMRVALKGETDAKRVAVRVMADWPLANVLAALTKLPAADQKPMLSALAATPSRGGLRMALALFGDAHVRAEARQAVLTIAEALENQAKVDATFFNGKDLSGWSGTKKYWSVKDGAIVGSSGAKIPRNEFIWSNVLVADFYLVLDVKLTPPSANAGIQFRSKKVDKHGQAEGYQADVGQGWWGKLYHEHGRKLLDDNKRGEQAVKPGQWNRYEILAVGPAIWTAINGTLCTTLLDVKGEASGHIALQIHSGPPMTACYRIHKLVHNPKLEIAGKETKLLLEALSK